jgi:hypothetical protein
MSKRVLYHGTSSKNVDSIMVEGLSRFWEGVYLTDSAESAAKWTGFRLRAMGEETIAVIKVIVDSEKLQPGSDHSPMMVELFGVGESILHDGAIPADQIIGVEYYGFKTQSE